MVCSSRTGGTTQRKHVRTALLLSGWPRFHAEFDEQLANLHGSEIDWIVVLWKNYPTDADFTLNACLTPSWLDQVHNEQDARVWLEARMPETHRLAHVSFVDWDDFPPYMIGDYTNQVPGTNPEAIFRQFWMLQQVNTASKAYAPYDLVIRSRTDLAVSTAIHLDQIHAALVNDPQRLVIPSNNRQGYQQSWCDFFAVGLPDTMDVYASAVDYFNEFYFHHGVTMHPENIVSHVLHSKGVHWGDDGIVANIRQRGQYLTPHFVRGKKYYQADFGRW